VADDLVVGFGDKRHNDEIICSEPFNQLGFVISGERVA
jgi:hypothetical protein